MNKRVLWVASCNRRGATKRASLIPQQMRGSDKRCEEVRRATTLPSALLLSPQLHHPLYVALHRNLSRAHTFRSLLQLGSLLLLGSVTVHWHFSAWSARPTCYQSYLLPHMDIASLVASRDMDHTGTERKRRQLDLVKRDRCRVDKQKVANDLELRQHYFYLSDSSTNESQCTPRTRVWPTKCERCSRKGFPCSDGIKVEHNSKKRPSVPLSISDEPGNNIQTQPLQERLDLLYVRSLGSFIC